MNFLSKNDYNASVIVTSDTCSKDPSKDTSGEYLVKELKTLRFKFVEKYIVEDDKEAIKDCILSILKKDKLNVFIITTGGTGLCPRDVTPDATSALYDRRCNGIETCLYMNGLRYSSHAALSRLTAGVVGNCLIINLPGKLKACKEYFPKIENILEHALEQINYDPEAVKETHEKQFREDLKLLNKSVISSTNQVNETSVSIPIAPNENFVDESCSMNNVKMSNCSINQDSNKSEESKNGFEPPVDNVDSLLKTMKVNSPYPMTDYHKALNIMEPLSKYICQTDQVVELNGRIDIFGEIIGRHLAENLYSKSTIPQYPCSTVDGYVMNLSTTMAKFLSNLGKVHGTIVANLEEFERLQNMSERLNNFFCYQINTGGRLPEKNFIIIPIEETRELNDNKTAVTIEKLNVDNNTKYIRKSGIDLNPHDCLKRGTKIGPIEMALIISMGHKSIKLIKQPHICVFTTGDELISFEEYCEDDSTKNEKVVDSNGPLLSNLFKSKHYSVLNLGIVKDNPKDILLKIQTGLILCDIIVITGGASMGSKDHVKDVVEQMGGTIHFGRVNIKPGKPAAFASIEFGGKKKFIFCLPGNPVSAYITTFTLVIPFIEHGLKCLSGNIMPLTINDIGDLINVELADIVAENCSDSQGYVFDGRLEFVRAKLLSNQCGSLQVPYKAIVSTRQQSSCLMNLLNCDCLIIIEPDMKNTKFVVGQCYRALKLKN